MVDNQVKIMKRLLIIVSAILCVSCNTSKNVIVVHDTVERSVIYNKYKTLHDSIYIDRWHSTENIGDTIYRTDSIVVYSWRYSSDTIRDTVTKTIKEKVPVEIKESKYNIAGILILGILFSVLILLSITILKKPK